MAIGRIVSQWGFLEYAVFSQTLQALSEPIPDDLPKAMNNIQFTSVLALWKEHVVDKAESQQKTKLEKVYDRVRKLHDYRNALVHGMWEWNPSAPENITATRIRKREIITIHFTASDLEDFAKKLGEINFDIVYRGGVGDRDAEMAARGSYISRRGLALMTSHPITKDFNLALFAGEPST